MVDVMSHAELSFCNMVYSNWKPSQTAGGGEHHAPLLYRLDQYPISVSQSHVRVTV